MNLQQFIKHVGQQNLADLLGVSDGTISNWNTFRTTPSPEDAYKLIKVSHGMLDWASIYEPYIDHLYNLKELKKEKANPIQLKFPF